MCVYNICICVCVKRKQKKWGRSRQSFSGQGTQRGFWRTGNFFFLTLTLNPLEDPLNYDVHFLVITACVCVCAQSLSHAQLFANLWTVDCQAPLSMGVLQVRILEWVAICSSRGSSQPRDRTHVSCIEGRFFTTELSGKPQ